MATFSCIIITTLIVVSLANLLLLVHVIMGSKGAECQTAAPRKKFPVRTRKGADGEPPLHPVATDRYRFLVSLNLAENGEFICGAAVISRRFVLVTSHCAQIILNHSMEKIKVSSRNFHDIEEVLINREGFALVAVKQALENPPIVLPKANYLYRANTSAVAIGWMEGAERLYTMNVKLLWGKVCQSYRGNKADGAVCAGIGGCVDLGGVLVAQNVLVGLMGGAGRQCAIGIYQKTSGLEDWVRGVEKQKRFMVGAIFKNDS